MKAEGMKREPLQQKKSTFQTGTIKVIRETEECAGSTLERNGQHADNYHKPLFSSNHY